MVVLQFSNSEQQRELHRLVTTYWSFKHAVLHASSEQDVCQESVQAAVATLRAVAALRSATITNLGGGSNSSSSDAGSLSWSAALEGLSALPDSIISLDLTNARLPGPAGLDLLLGLPYIQHLTLQSSSSGKLQQQHVAAIASMQQLRSLKLLFRTVAGVLAEPLTLDPLGKLSKLTQLEIRYTGMPELATGVCFANAEELLLGCKQLASLVLSRVPTPSLRGLFKLEQLRQLTLLQLAPLDENQARSLALCTQLQQLTLDNMPLELLPRLASLTGLTSLQLSLYNPPASQSLPGGVNLLSLSALVGLQTLSLSGPILIAAEQVQVLGAACVKLRHPGFAGFKVLEVLRVKPWCGSASRPVGDAGLGGDEEGPLLSGLGGVTAVEADLPATLRELDGWQLNFAAPAVTAAAAAAAAGSSVLLPLSSMPSLEPQGSLAAAELRGLKSLKMHFSPDTPNCELPQLPTQLLMQGLTSLDMQHPSLTSEQLTAAVTATCGSLKRLSINAADTVSQFRRPVIVVPCPAAASMSAAACSSSSSRSSSSGNSSQGSTQRRSNAGDKLMRQSSASCTSSGGSTTSRSAFSFFSGAAAAAAAVAAAGPMAAVAGMPISGMAFATMAATAGIAGATAGAVSRSNSASFGRLSFCSIGNTASSSGGGASFTSSSSNNNNNSSSSSSRGFTLTSMGSIPTLHSMGSASLADMISDALGVGGSGCRGSGTGLSSMGAALNKGLGLAVLGQCSRLEELSVVIGDRGLGPRVREAIAALPQLRKLRVCVAADVPAAAVRDLGAWLGGLRQLQWIGVGLEGPGAADALPGLMDRLVCSLPACQVHVLKGRIGTAAY
ncbi:hypothetical protein COO60DRAFT_1673566 [Scenedesmus sp. NREL 46B-D3]|nr:hypothetical protein COO60DRAFT_1673566 [Scenedesmus sp. NREL 46B-D3]